MTKQQTCGSILDEQTPAMISQEELDLLAFEVWQAWQEIDRVATGVIPCQAGKAEPRRFEARMKPETLTPNELRKNVQPGAVMLVKRQS